MGCTHGFARAYLALHQSCIFHFLDNYTFIFYFMRILQKFEADFLDEDIPDVETNSMGEAAVNS